MASLPSPCDSRVEMEGRACLAARLLRREPKLQRVDARNNRFFPITRDRARQWNPLYLATPNSETST